MAKLYMSAKAICPYYKDETPAAVRCYDPCDRWNVRLTFGNRTKCKDHKETTCYNRRYRDCPIYRMLLQREEG